MFILKGGRLDIIAASWYRIHRGLSNLLEAIVDKSTLFAR
jgi:hypothetical protein